MTAVLFYSDTAEFGGHEAMTLEAVRCLSQRDDLAVSIIFYQGNTRLSAGLTEIGRSTGNLALLPSKFRSRSLQGFRSLISIRKADHLAGLMKQVNPSVVIVSQGRIESGSLGLLAANRAGFRTISYLPMAHPLSVSARPVALRLRQMVNEHFYHLPDKFITISQSARKMLLEQGARDVVVVPNGIRIRPALPTDRQRFRKMQGISQQQYLVGVIGRIDFRQKGQDFALAAISRFRDRLVTYRFFFVGEGPDSERLKTMIAKTNLAQTVRVLPWCNDMEKIYAGVDMLLIPSKFEGVPLVMLEAMSHKIPIIASDTDAMAELLPPGWLFAFGDCQALFERLVRVSCTDNSRMLEDHRKRVLEEFTHERFCANLSAAILEPVQTGKAAIDAVGGKWLRSDSDNFSCGNTSYMIHKRKIDA